MKHKEKFRESLWGYLFIAPIVLGFLVFMAAPICDALFKSFTNASLLGETSFIGLDNYKKLLFDDRTFRISLKNTLVYSVGLVPLNIIMAFFMAVLLKKKVRGIGFFRTAFFTPVVMSVVAWGIIWKFILGTDAGLLNLLLRSMGIRGPAWLYSPNLTMAVVIVVSVLKNVGMNMVIILSALHGVPESYYEAAQLDGVTPWKRLTHITIPLISSTIFMLVIVTLIGSLKVFGQIYSLTGGGPGNSTKVLVYYVYEQAFKFYEFGYASAAAFILFLLVLVFTLIQWKLKERWVYNEG